MSSSWLSVGKSFKRTVSKSDEASGDPVALNTILGTDSPLLHADRKRNSEIGEGEHDRKKHKKDKKDKKVKKGSSKKSKKDRKDKKELTSREKPSTALVPSRSHKSAALATDRADFSSSDSDFSSSDDESRTHNSTCRIIHQNRAEIMSGNSELTFLPNGEVVLLPSFARADDTSVSWMVDSRGDRNNLIYAGTQPSEHVYTVYPGAIYYTNVSHLPPQAGYTVQSQRLMQPMTSAQQYRRSVERPSGIVVSAKQQHRDYDQASKTTQIFMHRTELLSERRRETRLNHKYRYFSPTARSVLNDAALNRLRLNKATQSGASNNLQNVSVMLPFSYIDSVVLSELGFPSSTTATSANTLNSLSATSFGDNPPTSETDATNYTTTAARAQNQCNALTRDTNLALREKPHDLHTILHAVSVQDTICTLQLVAAGRSYDSITHARANNKTQLALQRSIAERKVAILEQSIENNRGSEYILSVLYEQIVCNLMQSKQAEKISHSLARATVDCPYNVAVRMVQHIYNMGVFNTSACTMLANNLNTIYNVVSLAAQNALAAQQLNTSLHNVYNNTTSVGTMSLQQVYQQLLLEEQLVQLQCDMLVQKVLVEKSAGNVEKAVAMAQAVLDFNLSRSVHSVEEYCTYWDSECIRMGELYHILPSSAYMTVHSSHTVGSSSSIANGDIHSVHRHSEDTGYDAWIGAGRPAEPPVHSLFSPDAPGATSQDETSIGIGGATLNCLRDDVSRIVAALDIDTYTQNTAIEKSVSTYDTTATVSDSDCINPHIDQNAAAAEYFLQQMLVSDTAHPSDDELEGNNHLFSVSGDQSTIPATTAPDTVNTTNNVADPEEDMVYSRLHGYKIKVHKESTGAIYKKILTDMGSVPVSDTNTADDTSSSQYNNTKIINTATELTANKLKQLACAGTSTRLMQSSSSTATCTTLSKQWKSNVYCKYTQYRPLRAAAFVDSASVEQQPERVIFSSDIRSALFKAEYSTDSSIIDAPMRQKMKQTLVVRVLQALGVVFLHNTCSHSLFSRSCALHSQDINNVLNVDESVLYNSVTNVPGTNTTPTSPSCYVSHLLIAGNAMLMPVCTVPVRIIKAHLLCAKLGLDSELNFIIRVIADILHTSTNDTKTSDDVLSAEFVAQLRCVLLRLLTIRCHAELCACKGAGVVRSSTESYNSVGDTDIMTEAITHWRTQCRSLLEASICTTAATQDNAHSNVTSLTPLVGELSLWAEYLQCEVMLRQTTEALKLADKVLKSLQPPSLTSANERAVRYSGIEKLTYTAILLALQANSASTTNTNPITTCLLDCAPANVHNALSVLTQYAHNLSGLNPTFGKYNNELKPTKATTTKAGKNTNVPARLSQECIVGAMEALQNAILVKVEKLQEQVARQRRNEGVHLQVEDGSQIEFCSKLYHLVLLMAWLQFLSTLYASSSAIPTTISTTMIDEAVQQGDAVFTAANSMLRSILIPRSMNDINTTTQNSSCRMEGGGEKRHYSRFFNNFLPETQKLTCNSGAIERASIPELQYVHNVSMTSEAEVSVVLLLERLHCARLHFILQTSASAVITHSNNIDRNKPLQLSPSCKNTLQNAIQAAIRDFPLNKYIQLVHTVYAIAQPAGVTHMRAYYKDIAQNRQLWGGSLLPSEILHMLCVEIFQANKTLLLDPLKPTIVACSDVFAVFDTEEVYNSHQCNSAHSAATQAPSLCRLWSDDSAQHVRTFLEATLSKHTLSTQMPVLWVFYIHLETSRGRFNEAKRLFFRAVSVCGWCQNLYTLCWGPLKQGFSESELTSLSTMMEQRGLHPLRAVEDDVGM